MNPKTVNCLICANPAPPLALQKSPTKSERVAEILTELFQVFATHMNWNGDGIDRKFDFNHDPFPFCKPCKLILMEVHHLNKEAQGIFKKIKQKTAVASAKILGVTDEDMGLKGKKRMIDDDEDEDDERKSRRKVLRSSTGKAESVEFGMKVQYFRNETVKNFLPTIRLKDDLNTSKDLEPITLDSGIRASQQPRKSLLACYFGDSDFDSAGTSSKILAPTAETILELDKEQVEETRSLSDEEPDLTTTNNKKRQWQCVSRKRKSPPNKSSSNSIKRSNGSPQLQCDTCNSTFSTKVTLKIHKVLVCGNRNRGSMVKIDENTYVFDNVNITKRGKLWVCSHCGLQLVRSERIRYHIRKLHAGKEQVEENKSLPDKKQDVISRNKKRQPKNAKPKRKPATRKIREKGSTMPVLKRSGGPQKLCKTCNKSFHPCALDLHQTLNCGDGKRGSWVRTSEDTWVFDGVNIKKQGKLWICSRCDSHYTQSPRIKYHIRKRHSVATNPNELEEDNNSVADLNHSQEVDSSPESEAPDVSMESVEEKPHLQNSPEIITPMSKYLMYLKSKRIEVEPEESSAEKEDLISNNKKQKQKRATGARKLTKRKISPVVDVNNVKRRLCGHCNNIFSSKTTLNLHQALSCGEGKRGSWVRTSKDTWVFDDVNIKKQGKLWICMLCDRHFTTATHCKYHIRRCHSVPPALNSLGTGESVDNIYETIRPPKLDYFPSGPPNLEDSQLKKSPVVKARRLSAVLGGISIPVIKLENYSETLVQNQTPEKIPEEEQVPEKIPVAKRIQQKSQKSAKRRPMSKKKVFQRMLTSYANMLQLSV